MLARSPAPAVGFNGMVVTAQHLATQVGVDVLRQGGNAVDAAVAVGYALAVTLPGSGNIGGGGFMLIRSADGQDVFLDFRERASLNASEEMFQDADGNVITGLSTTSWLGVGVPGTVMGLEHARVNYGTMSRAELMAPAVRLAREGFELVPGDDLLTVPVSAFRAEPNVAAVFLRAGEPYRVGDRVVQTQLAATLQLVSDEGPEAFYRGPIAAKVVAASAAGGGILDARDFAAYEVREYEPVRCAYRGYEVISAPPPSSGGTTLCLILNVLEGYPMGRLSFNSVASVHLLAETMRHAYAARNTYLGDPEFVSNPVAWLLSREYAAQVRELIDPNHATPSSEVQPGTAPSEGPNTTHYSIVDARGNAVAVTYTLNTTFGVRKMAADTGFLLNNQLDDFSLKPGEPNTYGLVQGEENAVAPGKTPLSSMTPTIVTRGGEVFMVTGSPGGSRIISTTLESILNVIDHGMSAQRAVDAPRVHHQWLPDVLYAETGAIAPAAREALESLGHVVEEVDPWGSVAAILRDSLTGRMHGANDRRSPQGAAQGY